MQLFEKYGTLLERNTALIEKVSPCIQLRRLIANELNFSCQLDSNVLFCALNTVNKSTLADVRAHYARPEHRKIPGEDSPLIPGLTAFLEASGLNDPLTKIYVTTEALDLFPFVIFFFVLSQLPQFQWDSHIAAIQCRQARGQERVDPVPFVVGVLTLLTQFHADYIDSFIRLMGEYVRYAAAMPSSGNRATVALPTSTSALLFLEELCRLGNLPRKAVAEHVPEYVFNSFRH
eukprot:SAG31_NODE_2091_length_6465_cov_2.429626_6_plen_233_part_00